MRDVVDAGEAIDGDRMSVSGGAAAQCVLVATSPRGLVVRHVPPMSKMLVGRDTGADVPLMAQGVERAHARVIHRGHVVWVERVASRSALLHNGVPVDQARLGDGDKIELGPCEIAVRMFAPPAVRRPRSATKRSDVLVAQDPAMLELLDRTRRLARVDTVVLIEGETGTGRDSLARYLHKQSACPGDSFHPVSCGSWAAGLPFGAQWGGEDGASAQVCAPEADGRPGYETLYLDNVELSNHETQVRLQDLLDHPVTVLGRSGQPSQGRMRIVASTDGTLGPLVEQGIFLRSLYYRLHANVLQIPPLRERPQDIVPIAEYLLQRLAVRVGNAPSAFCPEVKGVFAHYTWPGNVRQLKNVVESAAALTDGTHIGLSSLPPDLLGAMDCQPSQCTAALSLRDRLQRYEAEVIRQVLGEVQGNRKLASAELGIPLRTLERRIHDYQLC